MLSSRLIRTSDATACVVVVAIIARNASAQRIVHVGKPIEKVVGIRCQGRAGPTLDSGRSVEGGRKTSGAPATQQSVK